jgi:hypothetical protein
MKPVLSLFAIFVLFQSLMFGNLVKLELPALYQDKWEVTRFNTQEPIDIFLRPEQGNKLLNIQNRNHWFSYQFSTGISGKNLGIPPILAEIPYRVTSRQYYSSVPVFIYTGALRL